MKTLERRIKALEGEQGQGTWRPVLNSLSDDDLNRLEAILRLFGTQGPTEADVMALSDNDAAFLAALVEHKSGVGCPA